MKPVPSAVVVSLGCLVAMSGPARAQTRAGMPSGKSTGGVVAVYDPQVPEELRVRGGLPNFFSKAKAGAPVRVAYLGGSITAANGWRPLTLAWFKERYPAAEWIEINAAISGTGSDYGACRIAGDVLALKPDLVFMEHRVNGGGGYEAKSVEGIVRQIRRHDPRTDICLVYTLSQGMLKDLQANRAPWFTPVMEKVANAYGIPSVDLGVEVARREKAGDLVFKADAPVPGKMVFSADGVHPGGEGHGLYRDVLARSMVTMQAEGTAGPHPLPPPLEAGCWETAGLLPIGRVALSAGWIPVDLERDPVYRDDFGRTHAMLRGAVKCGATGECATVKWNGTTIGFSDIPQGTGMEVEVTVDGSATPLVLKRTQTEQRRTYARFFYLPELAPGDHTAVLRIKALPEGRSYYLGQVLVVGTTAP